MAKLYFRYGAMNSGKTTLLLQTAHNYEEQNMNVIIVKPAIDTKGEDKVVSRIGALRKVDLLLDKEDNLYEIVKNKYKNVNAILVDEAQFLTKKQADQAMQIVLRLDIPVLCYGLRTDFLTEGFEGAERLLLIAHTIEEMKTICKCGSKAIFNARYVDGEFTLGGDKVSIDGVKNTSYISMCGKCYEKEKEKKLIKFRNYGTIK